MKKMVLYFLSVTKVKSNSHEKKEKSIKLKGKTQKILRKLKKASAKKKQPKNLAKG